MIKIKQGLENGVNGSAEIVWKDKTDYDDAHYITVVHVPQFRNREFHLHIYDKRKIYKAWIKRLWKQREKLSHSVRTKSMQLLMRHW